MCRGTRDEHGRLALTLARLSSATSHYNPSSSSSPGLGQLQGRRGGDDLARCKTGACVRHRCRLQALGSTPGQPHTSISAHILCTVRSFRQAARRCWQTRPAQTALQGRRHVEAGASETAVQVLAPAGDERVQAGCGGFANLIAEMWPRAGHGPSWGFGGKAPGTLLHEPLTRARSLVPGIRYHCCVLDVTCLARAYLGGDLGRYTCTHAPTLTNLGGVEHIGCQLFRLCPLQRQTIPTLPKTYR